MTFTVEYGDLFSHKAQALAHGVNCKGVAGAGVAALMKKYYPAAIASYQDACKHQGLKPGEAYLSLPHRPVLHCASQRLPGPDARPEWLRQSLTAGLEMAANYGLETVALPLIGGGIGGLGAEVATRIIREVSEASPISVTLVLH